MAKWSSLFLCNALLRYTDGRPLYMVLEISSRRHCEIGVGTSTSSSAIHITSYSESRHFSQMDMWLIVQPTAPIPGRPLCCSLPFFISAYALDPILPSITMECISMSLPSKAAKCCTFSNPAFCIIASVFLFLVKEI